MNGNHSLLYLLLFGLEPRFELGGLEGPIRIYGSFEPSNAKKKIISLVFDDQSNILVCMYVGCCL